MSNTTVRPTPVTVISWFLIISGGFSLLILISPHTYNSWQEYGINTTMAMINSVSGGVIQVLCGWWILKANSLGRTLYLLWIPVSLIIAWLQMPGEYLPFMFLSLCFYAVMVFLLHVKDAREYFNGTFDPQLSESAVMSRFRRSQRNRSDLAQVVGIFFLALSGFIMISGFMVSGLSDAEVSRWSLILVFLIPSAIFLIPGILLWGRKRWAAALGWTLLAPSILSVLLSVTFFLMQGTELWMQIESEAEPDALNMLMGSGWNGLIGVLIASILLIWQYKRDWEQVESPVQQDLSHN